MGVLRSCCGGERVARRELVPSMATAEPLLLLRCFGERRKQRKQEGSVALVGAHGRAAASRRRTPAAGQASHGAWPGRSVDRRRASPTRRLFSETEVTVESECFVSVTNGADCQANFNDDYLLNRDDLAQEVVNKVERLHVNYNSYNWSSS